MDLLSDKNRKYKRFICLLIGAIFLFFYVKPNFTNKKITAHTQKGQLTIVEKSANTGQTISGVELTIYQVGRFTNHNKDQLELTSLFKESKIDLNNLQTAEDQQIISEKLDSYIETYNILGTEAKKTNTEGKAVFHSLDLGLYFVKTTSTKGRNVMIESEPFLVSIPTRNAENLEWDYDILTAPKSLTTTAETNTSVFITFEAQKMLDRKKARGNDYTFILRNNEGQVLQVKNNENHKIQFDPIRFIEKGYYVFTVEEFEHSNIENVIFDNSVYEWVVHVEKLNNKLSYSINTSKDGVSYKGPPIFENFTLSACTPMSRGELPKTGISNMQIFGVMIIGLSFVLAGIKLWPKKMTSMEKIERCERYER